MFRKRSLINFNSMPHTQLSYPTHCCVYICLDVSKKRVQFSYVNGSSVSPTSLFSFDSEEPIVDTVDVPNVFVIMK